jgi:hypothetical protein
MSQLGIRGEQRRGMLFAATGAAIAMLAPRGVLAQPLTDEEVFGNALRERYLIPGETTIQPVPFDKVIVKAAAPRLRAFASESIPADQPLGLRPEHLLYRGGIAQGDPVDLVELVHKPLKITSHDPSREWYIYQSPYFGRMVLVEDAHHHGEKAETPYLDLTQSTYFTDRLVVKPFQGDKVVVHRASIVGDPTKGPSLLFYADANGDPQPMMYAEPL